MKTAAGWYVQIGLLMPLVLSTGCPYPEDPSDVVVYADHVPARTFAGLPFENPFVDGNGEPPTRLVVEEAPGLTRPLGTQMWGVSAWMKYVLIGNFEERSGGLSGQVEDQRLGIFDSETREFCLLDLQVGAQNASVQWLAVVDLGEGRARIYYEGFVSDRDAGTGSPFGYIAADIDQNPCRDPWPVVAFSAADLNTARVSPGDPEPCPGNHCGWDGMALLKHDENTGKDLILLQNWHQPRMVVVEVDPDGLGDPLKVLDVYEVTKWWQPPAEVNPDNYCFKPRPVGMPSIDSARTPGDLRWVAAFDRLCDVYSASEAPSCKEPVWICRLPGKAGDPCIPGDGECPSGCTLVNPAQKCTGGAHGSCYRNVAYERDTCQDRAEGECVCDPDNLFLPPAQEYSFDWMTTETSVSPTSAFFQAADTQGPDGSFIFGMASIGRYDADGNLWLRGKPSDEPGRTIIYKKGQGGEHSYYTRGNPSGSEVHNPDVEIQFAGAGPLNQPMHALELGPKMYLLGLWTVQRATEPTPTSEWEMEASYRVGLGFDVLPSEAHVCSGSGEACENAGDCPESETCEQIELTRTLRRELALGGSPPSLWTTVGFADDARRRTRNNSYLIRLPLATALPDSVTDSRPSIAWTGGDCGLHPNQCRLWIAAQKGGAMKYRVRDDGMWSEWFSLPVGGGSLQGGPAVIASDSSVGVYVRNAGGVVLTTQLTSAVTCDIASCTWRSSWYPLRTDSAEGGQVVAGSDVAATFVPSGGATVPLVAVRNASDGNVFFTQFDPSQGGFIPWQRVPGLVTNAAPAVAYHAVQGSVWLAARDDGSGSPTYGKIMAKVLLPSPSDWAEVGTNPPVSAWGTAPAIASNGDLLQVFAAEPTGYLSSRVHQAIMKYGVPWGNWRQLPTRALSTRQPAAAAINGDVNLLTYWNVGNPETGGMAEQAVE